MKNGIVIYEKFYQILKNKIECGLIPKGSRLPSRAALCREFATSEKTVRRVVEMLAADGYVETSQRRRPTVIFERTAETYGRGILPLQKADATAANDILKTGILVCYPVISSGISRCTEADWEIPEAILEKMDPSQPAGFWRLSNRFWRFFAARNENDLILRAVDGLGFADLDPLPGTYAIRCAYCAKIKEFLQTVKRGGAPESVHFDDLSALYGFVSSQAEGRLSFRVAADSPMRSGTKTLYQRISKAEERYSRVYLDILGLIAIGRYQPGDRLPSHAQLRENYGVSIDSTVKAIHLLQKWGVVTAIRGKGIFVAMESRELSRIRIDPALIACHIRRYLDSLELLSLTIEGVAAHAAVHITPEEAKALGEKLEKVWNEDYLYQLSPIILLEFIVEHIQYDALKAIYTVVQDHYHIGRSIPKLLSHEKNQYNLKIHQECRTIAGCWEEGEVYLSAKKAADMYQYIQRLIAAECKRLGYWENAMQVYDGTFLWK